jgi:tRNA pseudouridine55 synthase
MLINANFCTERWDSFSALKMDGRPLYEYARKGIPLPRPIDARTVTVHTLEIESWLGGDHEYVWPTKALKEEEKTALARALQKEGTEELEDTIEEGNGLAFVLKMTVSSGTYVRSLVHDLAHAVGSAGHVVRLTRSRQGRFVLGDVSDASTDLKCMSLNVFEETGWEEEVQTRMELV